MSNTDVHTSHCCAFHGCKYSDDSCTVVTLENRQEHPCEECGVGAYDMHRFDPARIVWSLDFLSYELLTVDDIPAVLTKSRELPQGSAPISGAQAERPLSLRKCDQTRPPSRRSRTSRCAFKYAAWLYAHMFATKWERA